MSAHVTVLHGVLPPAPWWVGSLGLLLVVLALWYSLGAAPARFS